MAAPPVPYGYITVAQRIAERIDIAKPTSAETDWVRVLTPYAGDGKGQLFTPEVGSQVLMHYQQHPEQPLVLGLGYLFGI